jgi:hypothetical protein
MASDPLTQAYIPKTMGQMVWVCGSAEIGLGSLVKLPLKNKDLSLIFGSVLGSVGLFSGAFQVTQRVKKIKGLGQPPVRRVLARITGAKSAATFARARSRARSREVVRGAKS